MVPHILHSISLGRLGERLSVLAEPKKASVSRRNSLPGPRPRLQTRTQQRRPDSLPIGLNASHDQRPTRVRIPAVTSTARTTAPEKDKTRSGRNRRRYPNNLRQRPQ